MNNPRPGTPLRTPASARACDIVDMVRDTFATGPWWPTEAERDDTCAVYDLPTPPTPHLRSVRAVRCRAVAIQQFAPILLYASGQGYLAQLLRQQPIARGARTIGAVLGNTDTPPSRRTQEILRAARDLLTMSHPVAMTRAALALALQAGAVNPALTRLTTEALLLGIVWPGTAAPEQLWDDLHQLRTHGEVPALRAAATRILAAYAQRDVDCCQQRYAAWHAVSVITPDGAPLFVIVPRTISAARVAEALATTPHVGADPTHAGQPIAVGSTLRDAWRAADRLARHGQLDIARHTSAWHTAPARTTAGVSRFTIPAGAPAPVSEGAP